VVRFQWCGYPGQAVKNLASTRAVFNGYLADKIQPKVGVFQPGTPRKSSLPTPVALKAILGGGS